MNEFERLGWSPWENQRVRSQWRREWRVGNVSRSFFAIALVCMLTPYPFVFSCVCQKGCVWTRFHEFEWERSFFSLMMHLACVFAEIIVMSLWGVFGIHHRQWQKCWKEGQRQKDKDRARDDLSIQQVCVCVCSCACLRWLLFICALEDSRLMTFLINQELCTLFICSFIRCFYPKWITNEEHKHFILRAAACSKLLNV